MPQPPGRTESGFAASLWRVEVFRHVLPQLLAGCIAGVVAACGMVASNLGSLRDLVLHTDGGWIAFGLLVFGMVVTLGSVAIGAAIMTIPWEPD